MVMEERTLELKVVSAQDLKKVKKIGHQTCYAVAYINSNEKKASWVDKDGGVNPTWNAELKLACEDKLLQRGGSYITVDIYSYGRFSNKLVGTSRISLLEIGKHAKAAVSPKRFSFQVRRPSGVVKGVLKVTVKLGEMRNRSLNNTSGKALSSLSEDFKRLRSQDILPMGHSQVNPPKSSSPNLETLTPNPPPKVFLGHSASYSFNSNSSSKRESEPVLAYPAYAYPAHLPHQYGQQYGTQNYDFPCSGSRQSFYPSTQALARHKHQKVHYSKPPCRRHGGTKSNRSSGLGMGLFGGVLGGLLLGDVLL